MRRTESYTVTSLPYNCFDFPSGHNCTYVPFYLGTWGLNLEEVVEREGCFGVVDSWAPHMIGAQTEASPCDVEAIHLIGSVQPYGALLVASQSAGRITHASANIQDYLGFSATDLFGRTLSDIFSTEDVSVLASESLGAQPRKVLKPLVLTLRGREAPTLDCLPHRHGDQIILEFVSSLSPSGDTWEEDDLRRQIISDLVRPTSLADLAELSADIVRRVNGFDRVMIYRFADDGHGEVIAEQTNRPDSYLGLHYPASDLPEPARRHFQLNVVRAIPDIYADAVPVLAHDETAGPLDMTYTLLRAVPETHLQYLRNMGVVGSMSISLVANDKLWGLIACHHYTPRQVSVRVLRFAELLAGTISALLQGIENRTQLSRAIEAEKVAFAMEKQGRNGVPLREVVREWAPELLRLLDAQGLVLRQSGAVEQYGSTPSQPLRYAPLRSHLVEGVAATDRLETLLDMDDAQRSVAAGAGYMELSGTGQDYLVLLREQFEHVVTWAGKPETVEEMLADGSTRLNPRASFAHWTEERAGRSRPFDTTDLEALRIVRRALFALNSLEREHAAVQARRQAEAEEERLRLALLDAARTNSMGELASALAHELNQPLAAVANYINACRQQLKSFDASLPSGFDALMLDAVSEAARASDLVRRLRDFIAGGALQIEESDLHAAVRQGADLAMLAHGTDRPELVIDMPEDLPRLWIDGIQIGQVVLNLAMNAITAMRGREERLLTIRACRDGERIRVSVQDTGPGIAREMRENLFEPFHSTTTSGMGIGLSLCRSIVEAHGGRIWAPECPDGCLIEFTLPVRPTEYGD